MEQRLRSQAGTILYSVSLSYKIAKASPEVRMGDPHDKTCAGDSKKNISGGKTGVTKECQEEREECTKPDGG